ncbi:hypothetical protein Y032_0146g2519 [Ancylostoma ceylanicum]|uniref:Uncharacterized protein n=1 Tax=Ancylostoma ceylanicum TaxID=53326 RepID=A0A016T246_9BILA|nr:hypothetical protein Y032_0146g2519 [Ancylostoma ceylanicum]
MPVNDLHATLRDVRSMILCEERAQQETNLEKVTASLNAVQNSVEELARKNGSQPMDQPHREEEVNESL